MGFTSEPRSGGRIQVVSFNRRAWRWQELKLGVLAPSQTPQPPEPLEVPLASRRWVAQAGCRATSATRLAARQSVKNQCDTHYDCSFSCFFTKIFFLSSICRAKHFHKRRSRRSRWIVNDWIVICKTGLPASVGPAARQSVKNQCDQCNLWFQKLLWPCP